MKRRSRACVSLALVIGVSCGLGGTASMQTSPAQSPDQKKVPMTTRAHGAFDVKIVPQPAEDAVLGRMTLDKQFHGDLEGTSKGQMLTAGTDTKDSGVYVAVERVTGKLGDRSGAFILHHTGIMTRGAPHLTIRVVPDSGTDQLVGISGTMTIDIVDGKHFYDFDYTLPATP